FWRRRRDARRSRSSTSSGWLSSSRSRHVTLEVVRAGVAICLVALGAGKLGGGFDDARFRCSDTSPCPTGRVCLAGYCEVEVPPDAQTPEPAVLGDVLMFTFDDGGLPSFRDRSGHRFDSSGGGAMSGV